MNEIMQEIQDLEVRLQAAEVRKNQLHDQDQIEYQNAVNEYNMISNKLSEKRDELSKLQETEQRVQRQQETIDAAVAVDILAQMFDSLFPADKFEVILGPNRYDVLSQDFKQMIQVYATTTVLAPVYQQHELELAHKDERYKLLNDQSLAVQQQLDVVNATLEQKQKDFMDAQTAADTIRAKAKQDYADHMANTTHLMKQLDEKDATIADLQNKLVSAQQPKAESKPSQSLSEMMTAIKNKNETQADEWIARFNARQKSDEAKVKLPEVNTPQVTESPFRLDPQVEPQSSGFPAPGADAPVGGAQFPVVTPPSVPAIISGSAVDQGQPSGETAVTRAEFEELKAFVGKLEMNIDGSVTWSADEKEQVA